MAINLKRYIDIVSGVGAGARVPGRDLIGRIFTTNALMPTDMIAEFEEAGEVADFFGSASEEYKRAAFYFGFISKMQVRARKLGFVRYTPEAVAPSLRGRFALPSLAQLKTISDGSFSFTLAGNRQEIVGRNFSLAASYADIASQLEDGIRAVDSAPLWSEATVTYDATRQAFVFAGGVAGACAIEAAGAAGSGTPVADLLRWSAGAGALASAGYDATSVTDTLNHSTDVSNNFGSFLFLADLDLEQMAEASAFAKLGNFQSKYCQRVSVENAAAVRAALQGYDGVALTEYDPARPDEYPEMIPMVLLAATNYERLNGTQSYMFQQFAGLTPTVTDNTKANLLDDMRVNYYGRTQQAGQTIDFYQRGVLQGNVQDMNVYANEMWLKDRAGAAIMTLKLALPEIAADESGVNAITGCLQDVIGLALTNGTISVNKALTYAQRAFITQITGEETAWVQVQTTGWWLKVWIDQVTVDDRIEYYARYLLIYAKKDTIRKTEGTHSLI